MQPAKAADPPPMTVDEYLSFEQASAVRYTYFDGRVRAMAEESLDHGKVSANIVISLGGQLDGKPCLTLTKDTRVRGGPARPRSPRPTAGTYS